MIQNLSNEEENQVYTVNGMFEDYFLDYASYVILERAVPMMEDGFKPVHRRILHSMFTMEDGRFNKVANIIGQTMQFHPHGDASIGDALVGLGQKNLLIETQGNWGDVRTGDRAAAARYIEARLSKFALDAVFNPSITNWQLTYDGRKNEPVFLPVKFPILLSHGVEGIAVGLSTKILPHNFNELIDASIAFLKAQSFQLYPDFETGGLIDITQYQSGMRGGKVRVRAKIEVTDRSTLTITEIPFSVTCDSLIDSILKANEKGQIKIKRVTDNTAQLVEINIELLPGVSPEQTLEALYLFSDCEVSISPLSCVIWQDKPVFLPVEEILKANTTQTKALLLIELELKKSILEEKWFYTSLEKIFITQRIYRDMEECESWEEVMKVVSNRLHDYVRTPSNESPKELLAQLNRDILDDDIIKLTEIKIKKISKYSTYETDLELARLLDDMKQVAHDIIHITPFTIQWYEYLKLKYGKNHDRKTNITVFDTINVTSVVQNNAKLFVNRQEGFVGTGLKKDEFVVDCSDIDDIIVFTDEGKMVVTRIADKIFIGKGIIHVAVWQKNDERTTYNLIYSDGTSVAFAKRFNVTSITRDKEYSLVNDALKPKIHYFSVNPNGESERLKVILSPSSRAKIKAFDFDFSTIAIKGRSSKGNIVTKYQIKKIQLEQKGLSTLASQFLYFDEVFGKFNFEGKGQQLGPIEGNQKILCIYYDGFLELLPVDLNLRLFPNDHLELSIWNPNQILTSVYFEGNKKWAMVKRFKIESDQVYQKFRFIGEHPESKLFFVSKYSNPTIKFVVTEDLNQIQHELSLNSFIDVKGWKAIGNKLSDGEIEIKDIQLNTGEELHKVHENNDDLTQKVNSTSNEDHENIFVGDTIDFKIEPGQGSLFDEDEKTTNH